jgi:hypothetical protein
MNSSFIYKILICTDLHEAKFSLLSNVKKIEIHVMSTKIKGSVEQDAKHFFMFLKEFFR